MKNVILFVSLLILSTQYSNGQVDLTLSGTKPLIFTSIGTGLYDQSAIYNNTTNGFLIDLAKTSNDINATPIDFRIDSRGGTHKVFTIKGATGNIGIGTENPLSKLDIKFLPNGSGINTPLFLNSNTNMSVGEVNAILFSGKNNTDMKGAFGYEINETGYFRGDFVFYLNNEANHNSVSVNNEVMRIKNNGNVGIGTSSTGTHKFAVEGSIGAREIKVEASGWSDFVFEPNYELRTLEEVEQHIAENGHLPEIPSEAEVTKNGINLGEMNSKLLQKIEELTLYMIAMNKEMKELKAKNAELERKFNN